MSVLSRSQLKVSICDTGCEEPMKLTRMRRNRYFQALGIYFYISLTPIGGNARSLFFMISIILLTVNYILYLPSSGVFGRGQYERPGGSVSSWGYWIRCLPLEPPQDLLHPPWRRRARNGAYRGVRDQNIFDYF